MRFALVALGLAVLAGSAVAQVPRPPGCQVSILSLPYTIKVARRQYCLVHDLRTPLAAGAAITVVADDVTIDLNGFAIDNTLAGTGTLATGLLAVDRNRVTVRNGKIRGFHFGIKFSVPAGITSGGHLIENLSLDAQGFVGIQVESSGFDAAPNVVRNNIVNNTGITTAILGSGWGILAPSGNSVVRIEHNTVHTDLPNTPLQAAILSGGLITGNIVVGTLPGTFAVGIDGGTIGYCQNNTVIGASVAGQGIVNCTTIGSNFESP